MPNDIRKVTGRYLPRFLGFGGLEKSGQMVGDLPVVQKRSQAKTLVLGGRTGRRGEEEGAAASRDSRRLCGMRASSLLGHGYRET